MISFDKKIIFIHLPKTGGYSIKRILNEYSPDTLKGGFPTLFDETGKNGMRMWDNRTSKQIMHPDVEFYEMNYPDIYDDFTKFTVVRNPWDRLHSYVMWLNKGVFDRDKFMKALNFNMNGWFGTPYDISQIDLLKNSDGDVEVDLVFKYDNFKEELKKFFDSRSIECGDLLDVKINSVSKSGHYSADYDEEMIELVRKVNAEEIEYFDFKFEEKQ